MRIDYSGVVSSPLGSIGFLVQCNKLIALNLLLDTFLLKSPQDQFSQQVVSELEHYFHNPKHSFSLDFQLNGTPFQQRVWQTLQRIPIGETLTYGTLAKQLNSHPRAIGQACKKNPIAIMIPCHRIVAANHLGGYSGERQGRMMDVKKWLLQHERTAAV